MSGLWKMWVSRRLFVLHHWLRPSVMPCCQPNKQGSELGAGLSGFQLALLKIARLTFAQEHQPSIHVEDTISFKKLSFKADQIKDSWYLKNDSLFRVFFGNKCDYLQGFYLLKSSQGLNWEWEKITKQNKLKTTQGNYSIFKFYLVHKTTKSFF